MFRFVSKSSRASRAVANAALIESLEIRQLFAGIWQEAGGLVVMEAERETNVQSWTNATATAGYKGTGYKVWPGTESFNSVPSDRQTYQFNINSAGEYTLKIRNYHATTTEFNDVYMSVDGGAFTKTYSNIANSWNWDTKQEGKTTLKYTFSAGLHTIQFAHRSKDLKIDRISLFKSGVAGTDSSKPESSYNGEDPGPGPTNVTMDANSTSDFNKITGFASPFVPFYNDTARDALAINAATYGANKWAAAEGDFDGAAGVYDLTLHTLKELDGECSYKVFVNGTQVGSTFKNGTTSTDYVPQTFTINDVNIPAGAKIRVEANTHSNENVPEGSGFAVARGRWQKLVFSSDAAPSVNVSGVSLINADTDAVIPGYENWTGGTLNIGNLPTTNLDVCANTTGAQSVKFKLDTAADTTDNTDPYAAFGNTGSDYAPWTPTVGAHSLVVTPYTADNAGGTAGTPLTINFNVVNSPGNTAPNVDAGSAQAITLPVNSVNLNGTVTDDGVPGGPLTYLWEKVSGPGTVTFGDASLEDTTAAFNAPGAYVLKLTSSDGGLDNSDTVTITVNPSASGQSPRNGVPFAIPNALIECEDFDLGGEPEAYLDTSLGNNGNVYNFQDQVDIEVTSDPLGGYNVGWTKKTEYLEYTVDVAATGTYDALVRLSHEAPGGQFRLEFDGVDKTGAVIVPDTGTNDDWITLSVPGLQLEAGVQVMRLYFIENQLNKFAGNYNWIQIVSAGGSSSNDAPEVDAGSDATITLPSGTNLNATVTDDGEPSGSLTYVWEQVSGPGTVTFGNSNAEDTTATFSSPGEYVLKLTAGDGALTGDDTVTITVNPDANSDWNTGAPLPIPIGEVAGGIIGTKMYILDDKSTKMMVFNLSTQTWLANAASRPSGYKDSATEVVNSKLYVLGGVTKVDGVQTAYQKVQIYNPTGNKWTTGKNIPIKVFAAQTVAIGKYIYLAGGVNSSNETVNTLYRYDTALNTWKTLAAMPAGRNSGATGSDGTKMYIFGGRTGGNSPSNGFDTVMIYTPSTNKWISSDDATGAGANLTALPQARGGINNAPYVNGKFYVIGGETVNGAGATPDNVYNRVDIYTVSTDTWTLGEPMPTARHGVLPLSYQGKIYVAGGGIHSALSESDILEILTL